MTETKKCAVTPGPPSRLDPCRWLAELVTPRRGLGVQMKQLVSMETMKPTRQAWTIHSGKWAKSGVHMNFCPMCGGDLQGLFAHLLPPAVEVAAATAKETSA